MGEGLANGSVCWDAEDLSSIPRTNTAEDTDFGRLFSDVHTPSMPLAWPSTAHMGYL